MVRKSQMMKGSLWSKTLPYFKIAVRAVTEMDSWTKPVMNQATQWTALLRPIIFITCSHRKTHESTAASASSGRKWFMLIVTWVGKRLKAKKDNQILETWTGSIVQSKLQASDWQQHRSNMFWPLWAAAPSQRLCVGSSWRRSKPRRSPCTKASCAQSQTESWKGKKNKKQKLIRDVTTSTARKPEKIAYENLWCNVYFHS